MHGIREESIIKTGILDGTMPEKKGHLEDWINNWLWYTGFL